MILTAIIVIPLAAAALCAIIRRSPAGAIITLVGALAALALSAWADHCVITSPHHVLIEISHWIELDSLGAIILSLVAFVNVTAAIFSLGYMDFKQSGSGLRYYLNYNLFVFSMLIVPMLQEPNIVWIAVELTTLFSVLLVGFENSHEALEAAWKYIVLTLMGAAIALLGFLLLFWAARQAGAVQPYTWSGLVAAEPKMSPVLLKAAFIFILVGLGAKVGLVPMHTWLPDAHSQAPTPVCALLSGVETTAVLYAILRVLTILQASPVTHAGSWVLVFGLISAGTAAFLLLNVRDTKRLFAFSTVEHMGIILTAVGLGGMSAHLAAILQIVGHAVTKSFCFYSAGTVLLLLGTRDIASIRGLIRRAPIAGTALLLGGFAIAGAPPFTLFLSEFSILKAGLGRGEYLAVGLLAIFISIAFFAILNHVSRMVFGASEATKPSEMKCRSLPTSCKITLVIAAVPVIVLGIFISNPLHKLIVLAAISMRG